ncbi:aminoacylase-1-like [Carassius auratus]|uniref:Aminoacylase-1-like n=1 Tax=Carassius auratus TaxID=7957 RepID=A0A6P6J579_CARAU|nr:aminoacylase-1-like [Carassius auratus]
MFCHKGMETFVKLPEFQKLNIGFALDEGLANPTNAYTVFYGEKNPWWITFHCPGSPGHGSRFVENTTAEKLKHMDQNFTSTEESDPWWHVFSSTCKAMNMTVKKEIFPAATDSRFIREEGLPAIGFSPMNLTPILLHDHNEYLNEQVFLRSFQVYECLVPALTSLSPLSLLLSWFGVSQLLLLLAVLRG